MEAPWHQRQPQMGARPLPFGPELYIDRDDFAFSPPPKWKRLSPGAHVRLRYGYIIRCDEVVTGADGDVSELRCAYLPDSRSGSDTSGVKPAGVIHWVAAHAAEPVRMRLYDRLFRVRNPKGDSLMDDLNPASLVTASGFLEPAAATSQQPHFQFERVGYFHRDPVVPRTFNRTASLRDSWRPPTPAKGG